MFDADKKMSVTDNFDAVSRGKVS